MELPSTIKIGGFTYTITREESDRDHLDDMNAWALTNRRTRKMRFDPTADTEQTKEALIHEILHAARHLSGTELPSINDEEHIVKTLGLAIHAIFVDNPDALQYLLTNDNP